MPQYELDGVGPDRFVGRARGRTPEEAVRRALPLADTSVLTLAEAEDLHGWRDIQIDGETAGRIRLHQRMQFRRD